MLQCVMATTKKEKRKEKQCDKLRLSGGGKIVIRGNERRKVGKEGVG